MLHILYNSILFYYRLVLALKGTLTSIQGSVCLRFTVQMQYILTGVLAKPRVLNVWCSSLQYQFQSIIDMDLFWSRSLIIMILVSDPLYSGTQKVMAQFSIKNKPFVSLPNFNCFIKSKICAKSVIKSVLIRFINLKLIVQSGFLHAEWNWVAVTCRLRNQWRNAIWTKG